MILHDTNSPARIVTESELRQLSVFHIRIILVVAALALGMGFWIGSHF